MKKIFHIIISVLVTTVLLLGTMAALPPKPVHAMSGSGAPEDPYIIMNLSDLFRSSVVSISFNYP